MRSATAVDYTTGILVYDNMDVIRRIIEMILTHEVQQSFLKKMELVTIFVKNKFLNHVRKNNNESGHNAEYSLQMPHRMSVISPYSCKACQYSFKVFQELYDIVEEEYCDLVMDCRCKIKLYMGHVIHIMNQRLRIEKVEQNIVSENKYWIAKVLIDYKMKAEPMYF